MTLFFDRRHISWHADHSQTGWKVLETIVELRLRQFSIKILGMISTSYITLKIRIENWLKRTQKIDRSLIRQQSLRLFHFCFFIE